MAVAAIALIRPLAWERPYAARVAIKKKERKKEGEKEGRKEGKKGKKREKERKKSQQVFPRGLCSTELIQVWKSYTFQERSGP